MTKELLKICKAENIDAIMTIIHSNTTDLTYKNNAALTIAIAKCNVPLVFTLLEQPSVYEYEKNKNFPIFRTLLRSVAHPSYFWSSSKGKAECAIAMSEVIANNGYRLPQNAQKVIDQLIKKYGHSRFGAFGNSSIVLTNKDQATVNFPHRDGSAYIDPFKSPYADHHTEEKVLLKNRVKRNILSMLQCI